MTDASPALGPSNVRVQYALFWLLDTDAEPGGRPDLANGLVATEAAGVVTVKTGIHTGRANVWVQPRTSPPGQPDFSDWDEVVELTVEAPIGHLRIVGFDNNFAPGLPALTASGPGSYRLRVHARGRDRMPDLVASDPVEDYLFTAWPAPPAPETVHKATDATGASRRRIAARKAARGPEHSLKIQAYSPEPGRPPQTGRTWRHIPPATPPADSGDAPR